MNENLKYLYDNTQIANILAEGFAKICQEKPKFPINYLARHLKNYTAKNNQKIALVDRLQSNRKIIQQLEKQKQNLRFLADQKLQKQKVDNMQKLHFEKKISAAERHEEILDQFCEWICDRLKLSGVYIGQLENQTKKINLLDEDGEEAHLELEKQKVIKFKFASESQKRVVVGKVLPLESVVGKLLNQSQSEEPQTEQHEGGQNQQLTPQKKGEVYLASVVGNQELKFFTFPKLGSYFAASLKIKSYLKQKLFDQNSVKVLNFRKVLQDFEKQMQEKETKFKQIYDEKANSGVQQKQLQALEQQFQRQKSEIKRPVQEQFSFFQRKFVICADTLGLDREITEEEKEELRMYNKHLKISWESQEKRQLEKDIESLSFLSKIHHQQEQEPEVINFQEQFTTLLEQQEKDVTSHEQVEKVKDNEKLFQLECNHARIQKTKGHLLDEKYLKFWNQLLQLNVVKYSQLIKQFLIFLGFRKEEFCFKTTNQLDWQKAKNLLKSQNTQILQRISTTNARGSKPEIMLPYAKCARIAKNLEGLDPSALVNYNIYLSFILRLLQIYTKTRVQDREVRLAKIQAERQSREQKIKEAEEKLIEKNQKLEALKAELSEKGELEAFDQQVWNRQYDQQNPQIQIPQEIADDFDRDLLEPEVDPQKKDQN